MANQFNQNTAQTYLYDESNLIGRSLGICFPSNNDEVSLAVKDAFSRKLGLVVQGSRTGIVGGALPFDSLIVNMTKLNRFNAFYYDPTTNTATLSIQSGVTLKEVKDFLSKRNVSPDFMDSSSVASYQTYRNSESTLFLPVNPTEDTATLGGIAASGATGTYRLAYGFLLNHISSMTVVLANSEIKTINRIDPFPIDFPSDAFVASSSYEAGYHTDSSYMNLFIGSEGSLGIIVELTLDITLKTPIKYGILAFFDSFAQSMKFSDLLKHQQKNLNPAILAAEEFFDQSCLNVITENQDGKKRNIRFPDQTEHPYETAIWLELHGESQDSLLNACEVILDLLMNVEAPVDLAMSATDDREFDLLSSLNHQLTESKQTKKGTRFIADVIVADSDFKSIFEQIKSYCVDQKLNYAINGSILQLRLLFSVEKISQQDEKQFYLILKDVKARCASDYGIGIIKKSLFNKLHQQDLKAMSILKNYLDPSHLLAKQLFFEDPL